MHDQADLVMFLSRSKVPTLIVLYSNYSVACMILKPIVDRLEKELEERVEVVRIDVHGKNGRKLAAELDLEMVPAFIVLDKSGEETWRKVGLASRRELLAHIESLL